MTTQHRWQLAPILLTSLGVLLILAATIGNWAALGWWQAPIYLGGALALAALFWFRRKLSAAELELEILRGELAAEQTRQDQQRRQQDQLAAEMEKQWSEQGARLDQREISS
jgi:hypothetical protein